MTEPPVEGLKEPEAQVSLVLIAKDPITKKWKYSFKGTVRIRDVNQIRRALGVEYLRSKRRRRLQRLLNKDKDQNNGK